MMTDTKTHSGFQRFRTIYSSFLHPVWTSLHNYMIHTCLHARLHTYTEFTSQTHPPLIHGVCSLDCFRSKVRLLVLPTCGARIVLTIVVYKYYGICESIVLCTAHMYFTFTHDIHMHKVASRVLHRPKQLFVRGTIAFHSAQLCMADGDPFRIIFTRASHISALQHAEVNLMNNLFDWLRSLPPEKKRANFEFIMEQLVKSIDNVVMDHAAHDDPSEPSDRAPISDNSDASISAEMSAASI